MKHNFEIEYEQEEFLALSNGFFSLIHLGASALKEWNDFNLEKAKHREQAKRDRAVREQATDQHEETLDFQRQKHKAEMAMMNEKINQLNNWVETISMSVTKIDEHLSNHEPHFPTPDDPHFR